MSIPAGTQPSDFLIGWVCIVEKEYYAALDVLDERWSLDQDSSFGPGSNATSCYELGRIGGHNVVINVPHRVKGGLLHAADITSQMKSNFPYIRFILLVGIGGGAPLNEDIRLGDVVFGDSVIQYMKGKRLDDSFEIDTDRLEPPQQLLTAVTQVRRRLEEENEDPVENVVDEIANRSERKRERYRRPAEDRLLESSLLHQDNGCECLQPGLINGPSLIARNARQPTNHIEAHRGIVGSADQVLKSAEERDRLSREKSIVCFEMEAAAVMRSTGCITIRGIADYADGHKNDAWHNYAALSAAVCAKKLLIALHPETVRGTKIDLNQEEFARRFQGVTGLINARLTGNEKNVQDAFKKVQEANDLLEAQAKLFKDFAAAQEGKDQETKDLLKSFQGKLQQQVNDLEQQVEDQQKRNASSDYVTREEWDSLKEQVERRKADIKATEALAMVGELTDILGDHIGNDDVRRVSEYTGFASRMFDKFHFPVRRSSEAPSIAGSDQTSLQSGFSTPPTTAPVTTVNTGESSTPSNRRKRDKVKSWLPGRKRDHPNIEPPSPLPTTPPEEIMANKKEDQFDPKTPSSLSNTATVQYEFSKTQSQLNVEAHSPLLRVSSDRSRELQLPAIDSPRSLSPRRPKPVPGRKPEHLQTPPPDSQNGAPSRRPPPRPIPMPDSYHSRNSTQSQRSNEHRVSRDPSEKENDPSRLSFSEKRKIWE
ncbi:uncharacterized protein FIESC28_11153 [Fusarium coffeatum]|uniref:Uncharacterized protein n=1 Tax=Fusarium coffeatum TaxID=231269 RepID=A0A366QPE9_9HYPO|nr:uncharacterized protein FIESC28_11153 [Fusarium coffeatum]RBR06138.1 hypothetical protein FIESC28_11153 [Fusarium coffeatum]